jgi:hypothetical protein
MFRQNSRVKTKAFQKRDHIKHQENVCMNAGPNNAINTIRKGVVGSCLLRLGEVEKYEIVDLNNCPSDGVFFLLVFCVFSLNSRKKSLGRPKTWGIKKRERWQRTRSGRKKKVLEKMAKK